jgi:hypothetical protein
MLAMLRFALPKIVISNEERERNLPRATLALCVADLPLTNIACKVFSHWSKGHKVNMMVKSIKKC